MTIMQPTLVAKMSPTTDHKDLLKLLIEGTKFEVVPKSLAWGRQKESVAQKAFIKHHTAEHGKRFQFKNLGLCDSEAHGFLGASPDGACVCEVCGVFLVEIKCPYTKRNFHPRLAALEHCVATDDSKLILDIGVLACRNSRTAGNC